MKIDECYSKLDYLPYYLKSLEIGNYNFPVLNLPSNLEELHIPFNFDGNIPFIPDTLKKVTISEYCKKKEFYKKFFNDALGDKCEVIIEYYNNCCEDDNCDCEYYDDYHYDSDSSE